MNEDSRINEHLNREDSSAENSSSEADIDENAIIKYYFQRGFSYNEILLFFVNRHNHEISYSTLLRRLKAYGLGRKGFFDREDSDNIIEVVRQRIQELINGPGTCAGYQIIWHTLEMEGLRVPHIIVQDMLKELDPDGLQLRRARWLKRRVYHNLRPNYSWHIDGYDKLKLFGLPIHEAIDGFSRKILWLKVTQSNNSPNNIATFFLSSVNEMKGCPVQLITDLGMGNRLAAAIHCHFRENTDASLASP